MNSVKPKLRSLDGGVCCTNKEIHSRLLGVVSLAELMFISLVLAPSGQTDDISREGVKP
jgi:hypothetical protein